MTDKFLKYFWNKTFFIIFVSILMFSILFLWTWSFFYPYIGRDGAYYLSVGREVIIYNVDFYKINVPYNPLGIYIYGLPNIFGEYSLYYTYMLLFVITIVNSFLFYKILELIKINKQIGIFVTTIFIFYFTFLGGTYVYLETITLFFLLLVIISFLKKQYFVTGCLLFLAFYTKQYALALGLPITVYTFFYSKKNIAFKSLVLVFFGFATILFLMYFFHSDQIDFVNYLKRLLGQTNKDGLLRHTGNPNLLIGLFDFFKVLSYYLFLPFSIILLLVNKMRNRYVFLFGMVLISSLMSLFFAQFVFYYLLIMPWFLVLLAISLNNLELNTKLRIVFRGILIFTLISSLYSFKIASYKKEKFKQSVLEIKKAEVFVPKGSKVYLFTNETLYYYAPYFSANRLKLGYTFQKGRTVDYIIESIEPNSFIIMSNKQYKLMKNKFLFQFKFIGSDDKYSYLKKLSELNLVY